MTTPLEGRVALVTGGGRGIGRAIAIALATHAGADIAVNYRRDADAAAQTVVDIEALGRRAIAYQASIDSMDADRAMVESALADFGFIDILVNNAGIASRGKSVMRTEPEELERVIRTHAFGPHHLSQAVLPSMRERERGDIVMISSVTTLDMPAGGAPYSMGKAALEALALTLAKEELRRNVRVNIVAPGLVDTTMGEKLMKAAAGIDDLRVLDDAMPFGHVCSPEDVANVVRWLVGPGNTYVTGQKINVDGLTTFMRR